MKKKVKILFIEDDKFLLSMYSLKFLTEGFVVHGAMTAEEGFAEASIFKPDLIMLDIMLPDEDGIMLLKKLKRSKTTAAIPVVLLSNLSEPAYREKGLIYGALDFWVKAYYDPTEIVDKVKKILTDE
ncbi:MAG: response regulator [Candidatus Falkowbacteria bacterium]|nr:response regulator [Candidatus Falkowbacteria bacterium]